MNDWFEVLGSVCGPGSSNTFSSVYTDVPTDLIFKIFWVKLVRGFGVFYLRPYWVILIL